MESYDWLAAQQIIKEEWRYALINFGEAYVTPVLDPDTAITGMLMMEE